MNQSSSDRWPALPYDKFRSTAHLLHMGIQAIGKLKLYTPFEPHWANVALWLTSRGLASGIIPYKTGTFSIDLDLIKHQVIVKTSWGLVDQFPIDTMSVAQFTKNLFTLLHNFQIDLNINPLPQEIPSPIPFDKDTKQQAYDKTLATAWWQILLSSYQVMQRYHSRFNGETPPIGLMWGTCDLRDVRYNGVPVPTTGENAGYIRRNAMDEAQIEIGWWHGMDAYQRAAFYSFTYPKPENIEHEKIEPKETRWDAKLGLFILDYEDLRHAANPDKNLLAFFESTYQVGARCAKWDPKLNVIGEPV